MFLKVMYVNRRVLEFVFYSPRKTVDFLDSCIYK
jgi:hypothetical protein